MAKKNVQRYNVPMIRDFIEHLLWELRISIYENTASDPTKTNPELVEQLARCMERRGTHGLLCEAHLLETEQLTPEEIAKASARVRKMTAERRKHELEALESLEGLFEEALLGAANPTERIARQWKAPNLLRPTWTDPAEPVDLPKWDGDSGAAVVGLEQLLADDGINPSSIEAVAMVRSADVILGHDVMSERKFPVYGRAIIEKIAAGEGQPVPMLVVEIDQETDDLEKLCAMVETVKGRHEYPSS